MTRLLCCSLMLLALAAGLAGCGQKGNLYLPEKNAPAQPAADTEAGR